MSQNFFSWSLFLELNVPYSVKTSGNVKVCFPEYW